MRRSGLRFLGRTSAALTAFHFAPPGVQRGAPEIKDCRGEDQTDADKLPVHEFT